MKRMLMLFMTAVISVSFVGAAFAIEQGNKRKGKYIYRKVYNACNERGEVDTPKPPLNPDAKTQAQWTQVFEQGNLTNSVVRKSGTSFPKKIGLIFIPICTPMPPTRRHP